MTSIGSLLIESSKKYPGGVVSTSFQGEDLSYDSFLKRARKMAGVLADLTVKPGDHVGIFLSNGPDFLIAYFGVHLSKAVAVLIPSSSRQWELKRIVSDCHLSCLICDSWGLPFMFTVDKIMCKRTESLTDDLHVIEIDPQFPSPNKPTQYGGKFDFPAVIIPSSGSTGHSKSVLLSHRGIIANALAYTKRLGLTKSESSLVVLPLASAFAHTTQMVAHLAIGGRLIFSDRIFIPHMIVKLLMDRKPTMTGLIASLLSKILAVIDSPLSVALRKIILAGAPIPSGVMDQCSIKLPDSRCLKAYGLTEAGPRVTQMAVEDLTNKKGSVGRPLPGVKVRIVDGKGEVVPVGEQGEIEVRSKAMMMGYYGNYELTSRVMVDGWLKTGDIGILDSDRYLYFVGRKKNLIIRNGGKVSPEEIEEFLCSIPGILESRVSPMPNKNHEEKIIAEIVLDKPGRFDEAEIIQMCRNNLATFKIPDSVSFVRFLPKTRQGKIIRTWGDRQDKQLVESTSK